MFHVHIDLLWARYPHVFNMSTMQETRKSSENTLNWKISCSMKGRGIQCILRLLHLRLVSCCLLYSLFDRSGITFLLILCLGVVFAYIHISLKAKDKEWRQLPMGMRHVFYFYGMLWRNYGCVFVLHNDWRWPADWLVSIYTHQQVRYQITHLSPIQNFLPLGATAIASSLHAFMYIITSTK